MRYLEMMTDQMIIEKSRGQIKNYSDVNLQHNPPKSVEGGLYDENIFGSKLICRCRRTRTIGSKCPYCKVDILTDSEYADSYGHYILPFPVIFSYKIKALSLKLNSLEVLSNLITKTNPEESLVDIWSTEFIIKETNSNQFQLTKGNKKYTLELNELHDDSNFLRVGTLGLVELKNYKYKTGESFDFLDKYLNQVIPISSPFHRPLSFYNIGDKKMAGIPYITGLYKSLIYYASIIESLMESFYTDLVDRASLCYILNKLCNIIIGQSEVLRTSKESLIRNLVQSRVPESGRSNIVADPSLPIDQVRLPRSLAYQALQSEIIDKLKLKYDNRNCVNKYLQADEEAMSIFNSIIDEAVVLLVRNPTLHKYNMMSFRVRLWDEIAIGIPLLVCKPFNADFDGDQMAFYFITDDLLKSQVAEDMSPRNLWYYEKNFEPIYVPNNEVLYGLHIASLKSSGKSINYDHIHAVIEDFNNGKIQINKPIKINDKLTYTGRAIISHILDMNLDSIIGENKSIDSDNIANIISMLYAKEDRTYRLQWLQNFSTEVATRIGVPTIPFENIYKSDDVELKKIIHSRDPENIKIKKLYNKLQDLITNNIKNLPNNNIDTLIKGTGRVKPKQLVDIYAPSIKQDGAVEMGTSSLFTGLDEQSFIELAINNRDILELKQDLTPISGYNSRQIITAVMEYKYSDKELSKDTIGILIQESDAIGRTKLDGTKVKNKSDKLIRVKSCIYNKTNIIYADEISVEKYKLNPKSAIGISFAQSLTEFMTQSALALKHGGTNDNYEDEEVHCISSGKILDITSDKLVLDSDTYLLTGSYSLPENIRIGEDIKSGELLISSAKKLKAEHPIANFSALIGLRVVGKRRRFESKCINYAPTSGKIYYDRNSNLVKIGICNFELNPDEIYFYPEGYNLNIGDRICTGVLNLEEYFELTGKDVGLTYWVFYKEIVRIFNKKLNSEIVELVFKTILGSNFSIYETNITNKNFINRMYYGETKKGLVEMISESVDEQIPLQNSVLLPIILGTKSDNKGRKP